MSVKQPLFTVATITYNSGQWVRQSIESVLNSSFTDFEYLISDDCSSDNTWEIIQEYKDPRIKAWRNDKNIGEYPNRNKVLQNATGKYLLYVDGDDILYKKTLRNLSEYALEFPEAASVWGVPSAAFWFAVLPHQFNPKITIQLIYKTKISISEIGFAETLFKTSALCELGGFKTKFRIGDTWAKKKIAANFPVLFVPMGFMLWRQSNFQASKKLNGLRGGSFENYLIDKEILTNNIEGITLEEKMKLFENVRSSYLKNLVRDSLKNFKIFEFIRICREHGFEFSDIRLLYKSRKLNYLPVDDISKPLTE
jgi:glycosyltransferase involved in cell wall biosynthesis